MSLMNPRALRATMLRGTWSSGTVAPSKSNPASAACLV
jgi:hypothetical protein